MNRSYEKILLQDLKKILSCAYTDIESFFERFPKYSVLYKGHETIVVLGQGAALHYIDNKNGIKDFDVWFFFPEKNLTLPYRRRGVVDFGESKFGKEENEKVLKGRRIDVLMRSDSFFNYGNPTDCLINYLNYKKSSTSNLLKKKAFIGLFPDNIFSQILWPLNM